MIDSIRLVDAEESKASAAQQSTALSGISQRYAEGFDPTTYTEDQPRAEQNNTCVGGRRGGRSEEAVARSLCPSAQPLRLSTLDLSFVVGGKRPIENRVDFISTFRRVRPALNRPEPSWSS